MKCPKCGGTISPVKVDGRECGGMPGIAYVVCTNCGYARATGKPKR